MRISFIILICFTGIFANADSLSFSDLLKIPSKDVKLDDYLKLSERESVNSMASTLRSVQLVRSMETLNLKNLESKSNPEKIQNVKSRIDLLSKTLIKVELTIAETLIYVVQLQAYFEFSKKLNDATLNNLVQKSKADLVAKKQKIFEMMLNHDIEMFKTNYDEIAKLNEKSAIKKDDKEYLSPDEIRDGILELEKMKQVMSENHKCLLDKSCHYCGLRVSPKSCDSDTKGRLNKILVERIDEAASNFSKRFEKWTK